MFSLSLCVLVAATPAAGLASSSLAVAPTQFSGDVGDLPTALFDDALLTAVQAQVGTSVIGADDISAMIGFEETKELIGCDATNCIADIGGALGVDRLMVMKVANLGADWVVTSKIINITETKVNARSSDFVEGGARQLLTALPAIVGKLFGGGGAAVVAPTIGSSGGGGSVGSSPAPSAPAAGPETDRAIAAMSASLRANLPKIWPHGELEDATPVPDTLLALATYRLRKSNEPQTGEAYSAARVSCKRKKQAPACVEAADRLLTGHGINESAQQAGEYLLRACKLGDAGSCTEIRAMVGAYSSGRSLYHRTSAEHLMVKMCLEEIPDSCEHLEGGAGVIDALSVACEQQNNAGACATLVAKGSVWRVGKNTRTIGYVLLGGTLIFAALAGVEYALAGVSAGAGDPVGEASSLAYALYFSVFAVVSFVGGLGFTGYGLYKVAKAKSRAGEGVSHTVAILPVIARQEDTMYSGLGLLWTF